MGAIDLFDARYDPGTLLVDERHLPWTNQTGPTTVLYTNFPPPSFMSWPYGTRDRDRVWADRIKAFFTSTAALARPAGFTPRHDRKPHCAALQPLPRVTARRVPTRLPRDAKGRVGWRRTRRAA